MLHVIQWRWSRLTNNYLMIVIVGNQGESIGWYTRQRCWFNHKHWFVIRKCMMRNQISDEKYEYIIKLIIDKHWTQWHWRFLIIASKWEKTVSHDFVAWQHCVFNEYRLKSRLWSQPKSYNTRIYVSPKGLVYMSTFLFLQLLLSMFVWVRSEQIATD